MCTDKCFYCERLMGPAAYLKEKKYVPKTKDHIIPTSKGGINDPKNKVECCSACNQLKADLTLKQFARLVRKIIANYDHRPQKHPKSSYPVILKNIHLLEQKIKPYVRSLFKPAPSIKHPIRSKNILLYLPFKYGGDRY